MAFFTRLAFFFYFTFATVYAGDYKFWISDVDVVITRSPHKDTLIGAIYVNGTGVTPASVIKLLGDQGGSDPVSFQPDNFAIEFSAPDNADIEISYSLVNKHDAAGADGTKLINAIGTAIGAAGAATGTSSITSILVACDGAVVGQSIFLTPTDLQKLAVSQYTQILTDPGSESRPGCGKNSLYRSTANLVLLNPVLSSASSPLPTSIASSSVQSSSASSSSSTSGSVSDPGATSTSTATHTSTSTGSYIPVEYWRYGILAVLLFLPVWLGYYWSR
ncbi:hypothetical protein BDV34DRAFT_216016 [Aspergillus parasiticus]|uniref:Uncharacterized protein n=1 Tax=Aspergillus parasiticus TaxID=5067 RepID=A0A5N6D948_ASPPA|nr:hypothetical protein BDV34DRAFT_216016 [Aspergillus parasiticus]